MVDIAPADAAPDTALRPRVHLLDLARGIAILAVIAYHFCWDLEEFGVVQFDLFVAPFWLAARTAIAGAFLFIAGVSLVLAAAPGIDWRRWGIRFAKIFAAAVLVSVVTYLNFPKAWVFFGILHLLALASVIGLAFVPVPAVLTALAGVVLLAIEYAPQDWLSADWLLWLGLGTQEVRAVDYTPVAPWLGFFLFGIAAGRLLLAAPFWPRIGQVRLTDPVGTAVRFLGRHTLIIYLVHQPILFGLFFAWFYLTRG
jgi:uncharacterized membrane protein